MFCNVALETIKYITMKKLGDIINDVVRRQNWDINELAEKLSMSRGNVYKIFAKESMDLMLLGRISKVLQHNFFEDVANDLALVDYEEISNEERERDRAIMQFLDVVPKVMNELGRDCMIQFEDPTLHEPEIPLPEYFMVPYAITFTYGEPYRNYPQIKKTMEECPQFLRVIDDGKGHSVEIIHTLVADSQCCNVVIDYKTKEEWKEMMKFVFDVINQYYTPGNKFNLQRTFGYRIKW